MASRYFSFLPAFPTEPLAITFIASSVLSQMALLAALVGVVSLPVIFLPTISRQIFQVAIASIGVATLFFDTVVFAQYRFHMNAVVVELAMSGQVVTFPLMMWLMGLSGIALLLLGEFFLLRWIERISVSSKEKQGSQLFHHFIRRFVLVAFIALFATHGIHIWAAAQAYQPVTMIKRYLPLFFPATSNITLAKYGFVNVQAIEQQQRMALKQHSDLNYPLHPLKTKQPEHSDSVNIVIILVDSWRADTFNAENTPHMWRYAQRGAKFKNHLSTGNATRTGVFGLFYGLPGTYWHAMLANGRSPILMDRLQALNYEMGIFAAAKLDQPEFDQTVFHNILNLREGSKGNSPSERDQNLTQDWLVWDAERNKQKPFFSFLFYDSPHGYDFPKEYAHRFEPMTESMNYLTLDNSFDPQPLMNRYKTSVHFVDSEVGKVLNRLDESGALKNTVVILSGDHGQEINDNRLNFWGHNSNYTNAQIHVPFAMFGPKIKAVDSSWGMRVTSHEDLVPTLAINYLGVISDPHDYSVGKDLLNKPVSRQWILSSKYSGYGVITDDYIVEVSGTGSFQVLDKTYRPLPNQTLNTQYMKEVFEQISLYNK